MTLTLQALMEWIQIGERTLTAGRGAFDAVKAALEAHGVEADTAQLDAVIIDAERRRAIAEGEATEP